MMSSIIDQATFDASLKITPDNGAVQKGKLWPGTRPPIINMRFLQLKMDATWGRGKYRDEIWDDNINPSNDWWISFAPSEEEIEAASLGYDFANPKEYFAVSKVEPKLRLHHL